MRLAELPTPVERAEALSSHLGAEVWIKRDDLTSPRYGGNKVRKLEYLLGEALAREADALLTSGAAGSHHALATALFARDLSRPVHVCAFPQPYSAHAEGHLRALLHAGAEVYPTRSGALTLPRVRALEAKMRLSGGRPFVLPPGGSSVGGVLGYVEAGLELARQMEEGTLPEPDAIFAPLGTGGTLAGLAIGLAAAGLTSTIVGVRVVPRAVANLSVLGSLIGRAVKHLRGIDPRFPDVAADALSRLRLDGEEYGRGYGEPTSSGRNAGRLARARADLVLDPTYTEKAFAALLRHARGARQGQRLLFVHTLSAVEPDLSTAPPLPSALRRLLKR